MRFLKPKNVALDSMHVRILDAYPAPKMKSIEDSCRNESPYA